MKAVLVKELIQQRRTLPIHVARCSPSMADSVDSSTKIKRKSVLKANKKLAPRKSKPKAKQVAQENGGKLESRKKKRTRIEDLYDNDEARFSVMERAEEVLANLEDEFPICTKFMVPSNVTHGFWLILPVKFCNLHLPMHDVTVILVDECGKEYKASYLIERHGLSAGWRGFSLEHKLLKGDILIFQLIRYCTLKVHVVRVYDLDQVDAALCLLHLVAKKKRADSGKIFRTRKKSKKVVETFLLDTPQKSVQMNSPSAPTYGRGLAAESSAISSDSFGSEIVEGSETADHEVKDFNRSQDLFPHDHLPKDVKHRFTAGKVS